MAALTRTLRGAAAALLLLLAPALSGCVNPFKPATPESPTGGGVVEDYSTPARLLNTLTAAMEDKGTSGGRLAWAAAMADSTDPNTRAFYAFQDPRVLSAWLLSSPVPPPDTWGLDLERQFYDKFVGLYSGAYVMEFLPDNTSPSDDIGTDTALLHRQYYVSAVEGDQPVIIAIGYVDLYLVNYDGRWWVVRWDDRLDPNIGVDPADQSSYTLGYRRLESLSGT